MVIAENIHQFSSRSVDACLGQFLQIFPCENNIIAIHQQIFFFLFRLFAAFFSALPICAGIPRCIISVFPFFPMAPRPVFARRLAGLFIGIKRFFQNCIHFLGSHPPAGIRLLLFSALSARRQWQISFFSRSFSGKAAFHMHIIFYFIPFHIVSRPVGAEYGTGGIVRISFRLIADFLYDLLRIVAGLISFPCAKQSSMPLCICRQLFRIPLQGCHRSLPRQNCRILL